MFSSLSTFSGWQLWTVYKMNGARSFLSVSNILLKLKYPNQNVIQRLYVINTMERICYPICERDNSVVEKLHGVQISDPYRYLEDLNDSRTIRFLDDQETLTSNLMKENKYRNEAETFLTNCTNYLKRSAPEEIGDNLFYWENSGLKNHNYLMRTNQLTNETNLIFDPNLLSTDGSTSIAFSVFSESGHILAYAVSQKGSDWREIRFLNTITGDNLSDTLKNVKFSSISWMKDDSTIFYSKFDEIDDKQAKDLNQKLYAHRLGTDQSEDILVCEFPDHPNYIMSGEVSECGNWLVISVSDGCHNNSIFGADIKDFPSKKLEVFPVFGRIEFDYDYVTNFGDDFIFRTNKDAVNYKLIQVNIRTMCETDYLSTNNNDVLTSATIAYHHFLIVMYISDVKNTLKLFSMKSKQFVYDFPLEIGSIMEISAKKRNSRFFYKFVSYFEPQIIYECDLSADKMETKVRFIPEIKCFNKDDYTINQVFYTSKDGQRIPMYVMHRKDLKKTGNTPCLLYGYGGFNISIMPTFSPFYISCLQMLGGCVAIANIRGGGEYGKKWHNDGMLMKKQNVFDDFICAAEYLISEGYTCNQKLITFGGSNGGLLIAACLNQRPDLFGACITAVGVLDMLRFHKFTIGHFWKSEYGDPDNEEDFKNVLSYSPLHNIQKDPSCGYPAVLVLAAQNDDRVVPLHSLKFTAQLQYQLGNHPKQQKPLLLHFTRKVGHGAGKPTTKRINEWTDIFCFIQTVLQLDVNK